MTTAEAAEEDGKETAAAMTVVAMAASSSSSSYTVMYASGVQKVEAAGPEAEVRERNEGGLAGDDTRRQGER